MCTLLPSGKRPPLQSYYIATIYYTTTLQLVPLPPPPPDVDGVAVTRGQRTRERNVTARKNCTRTAGGWASRWHGTRERVGGRRVDGAGNSSARLSPRNRVRCCCLCKIFFFFFFHDGFLGGARPAPPKPLENDVKCFPCTTWCGGGCLVGIRNNDNNAASEWLQRSLLRTRRAGESPRARAGALPWTRDGCLLRDDDGGPADADGTAAVAGLYTSLYLGPGCIASDGGARFLYTHARTHARTPFFLSSRYFSLSLFLFYPSSSLSLTVIVAPNARAELIFKGSLTAAVLCIFIIYIYRTHKHP